MKYLAFLLAMLALTGCVSVPKLLYATPQTAPFSVTLKDGSVMRYMRYLPSGGDEPDKKRPLIILLHGSGEAGDDAYGVLANGPWRYAAEHSDFPFVILAPQMERDGEWSPEALEDWLKQAEKGLSKEGWGIDHRRIYLTGLSRGGQGTWDFAMRYPHHFAAIAPVAGYSDVNEPCRLKGIPVWAFHGAKDPVVPIAQEQSVVDAAKACGVSVHFSVYEDAGHYVWERTYNDPDLYAWFLQHKRPLISGSPG